MDCRHWFLSGKQSQLQAGGDSHPTSPAVHGRTGQDDRVKEVEIQEGSDQPLRTEVGWHLQQGVRPQCVLLSPSG